MTQFPFSNFNDSERYEYHVWAQSVTKLKLTTNNWHNDHKKCILYVIHVEKNIMPDFVVFGLAEADKQSSDAKRRANGFQRVIS